MTTGSYIYYNTNILNTLVTSGDQETLQAEYEKMYKQYQYMPRATITSIYAEVDIYPNERDVLLRGHYILENKSSVEVHEFHLSHIPKIEITKFEIPGATLLTDDKKHGYPIYKFDEPLAPGVVFNAEFETAWRTPGFANSGHDVSRDAQWHLY